MSCQRAIASGAWMACLLGVVPGASPAAQSTAEVRVLNQPDALDSGPTFARAERIGTVDDPTTIDVEAFAEADLATGELSVKSKVAIGDFSDGLVVFANALAGFEDVLTVTRPAGVTGDWEIALPMRLTLGPEGFVGGAGLIQLTGLVTVEAPGVGFLDSQSPFGFYGPDDLDATPVVFENRFTVPGAYDTVTIDFFVSMQADVQACVPAAARPDECGTQIGNPVTDVSDTLAVALEAPAGAVATSESGVFPVPEGALASRAVPLPVPALLVTAAMMAGLGRRMSRFPLAR